MRFFSQNNDSECDVKLPVKGILKDTPVMTLGYVDFSLPQPRASHSRHVKFHYRIDCKIIESPDFHDYMYEGKTLACFLHTLINKIELDLKFVIRYL